MVKRLYLCCLKTNEYIDKERKNMLRRKTYKNWKEICKVMGWETTGGNNKKARLKELERLCEYHKSGHSFIIDKIYEEPKEKVGSRKHFEELNIPRNKYENTGVYKITLENKIYIGSTVVGFRNRFLVHYHGKDSVMKHVYKLIKSGGVFEIIEDMTGHDVKDIRKKEIEYIKQYSNDGNWEVVNRKTYNNTKVKKMNYIKKHKKELFKGIYKDVTVQEKFNNLVELEKEKYTNDKIFNYIDFKKYVFDNYGFKELL